MHTDSRTNLQSRTPASRYSTPSALSARVDSLRSMNMAGSNNAERPMFAILMTFKHPTPAIFAKKWISEFSNVANEYREGNYSDTPRYTSKSFDLVLAFNAEANTLGFTKDNMPPEHAAGHPGPEKNPFVYAQATRTVVNTTLIHWTRLREGEVIGGKQWHTASANYKTAVNALFLKVDQAEEVGLCQTEIDQELFERMARKEGTKLCGTPEGDCQAICEVEFRKAGEVYRSFNTAHVYGIQNGIGSRYVHLADDVVNFVFCISSPSLEQTLHKQNLDFPKQMYGPIALLKPTSHNQTKLPKPNPWPTNNDPPGPKASPPSTPSKKKPRSSAQYSTPVSEDELQRRALQASIETLKEEIAALEKQLKDTAQERMEIRLEIQILRRNETLRLQRLRRELLDAGMLGAVEIFRCEVRRILPPLRPSIPLVYISRGISDQLVIHYRFSLAFISRHSSNQQVQNSNTGCMASPGPTKVLEQYSTRETHSFPQP
ncbi:uncharacterized protein MYCFIDRAFT_171603 [Pseudocercospora fijiensis CIRAD86]|uniref:Uncharacterized protein n=1 Tax=Pseudocercospora fijiensis (strain CIRAD86) TaxID=383855 RepID=M2Z7H3_PSEFD|nr:uncharacterized protein MYCFIDRAFT_171603 [Pseudocercospora fijiensis CIRAD86]EME85725.1 hypothetical protein MYCFIDRAFT_171603 [Pseudocercospora fijiensis CIRAD86]